MDNNQHFRETFIQCKTYLLENYCILTQIDNLVSHMLENNLISSTEYQYITELDHAFDKLDHLLVIIIQHKYEHIQIAFKHFIEVLTQDGRTDICEHLQNTLSKLSQLSPDQTSNHWQYRETFIRCNQYILDNYTITSQINNLATSLFEADLITYKQHQYISETRHARQKLKYLLDQIVNENNENINTAFYHILTEFNNDGRTDICDEIQKTLEYVQSSPQPSHYRETVPELITRLHENCMNFSPIEMKQSLKKVKNYIVAKEFTATKYPVAHVPSTTPEQAPITSHKDSIDDSYTDLMIAVMKDDVSKVKYIIDTNVESVNRTNAARQTALILAVRNSTIDVISVLLKCDQTDGNMADSKGRTALMHGAARGDAAMLAVLLDSKLDLTAFDNDGLTFEFYLFGEGLNKYIYNDKLNVDFMYFNNLTHEKNKVDWVGRKTVLEGLLSRKTVNRVNLLKATLMYGDEAMVSLLLHTDIKDKLVTDDMKDLIVNIIKTLNPVLVNMLDELMIDLTELDKNIVEDIIISVMRYKCPDTCAALLEQIQGISVEDTALETALYILSVRARTLPYILKKESLDLNTKSKKIYGRTVFAIICQYGSDTLVSKLLEQSHIDFQAKDEDNRSHFMLSFCNSSKNVPRLLFDHPKIDIDVNYCDTYGINALMMTSYWGNTDMVIQLLQCAGVAINAVEKNGCTALMVASESGHTEVVTQLLQCTELAINAASNEGVTALMYASQYGHTEVVRQLLRSPGVAINVATHRGNTSLILSSQNGHTEVVTQLLQCTEVAINAVNKGGCTALIFASQNGHTEVVTQLLQCPGVAINVASNKGNTSLILASLNGHTEVVTQLLLCPDLSINAATGGGFTALMWASLNGHTEVVIRLLQCTKVAINAVNEAGYTALMAASRNGHTDVIKQLMQNPDLEVNSATHHNSTALTLASEYGHSEVVRQLLQCQDLNVNAADNDGDNSIIMSCREGHTDIVTQLLQCPQLDVNAKVTKSGATALTEACQKGHRDIVSHLLKCPRVEINETDHEGNTALMAACQKSHSDIVSQLLAVKHIDINTTNSEDKTALSYACEAWNEEIMTQLIAALEK